MYIEPLIFDEDSIESVVNSLLLHLIIYFTILSIIFIFNISQYIYTRNSIYLFYSIYILVVMFYQIAYTGMGKIYIWSDSLEWNRRSLVVLGTLSFLTLIQFSIRFLSLKSRSYPSPLNRDRDSG